MDSLVALISVSKNYSCLLREGIRKIPKRAYQATKLLSHINKKTINMSKINPTPPLG